MYWVCQWKRRAIHQRGREGLTNMYPTGSRKVCLEMDPECAGCEVDGGVIKIMESLSIWGVGCNVSPKKISSSPNLWQLWKWGVCRCNQVKMWSYWIRVSPHPMTGVPIKRGKFEHRDTETQGRRPCDNRGRAWSNVSARNTKDHQQPPEVRKGQDESSLRAVRKSMTLWFQTSGLQSCERINKPTLPSLWHFVTAAPGH